MSNGGFSKFFERDNYSGNKKKDDNNGIKEYFGHLVMGEIKNVKNVSKNAIYNMSKTIIGKSDYFYNHADIFCKFSNMNIEDFKMYINSIIKEVEYIMTHSKLKDINRINELNDWFAEQEELLEQHWLHPVGQRNQEMYALLLQHADKSQFFDTRSPEKFRVFLEEVRDKHRVAKSQIEAHSSEETNIIVRDNAVMTLKKINNLLRSLKNALNKYLLEVRESADKIQEENNQGYNKLLLYIEQSHSIADQDLEELHKKLGKIKNRYKAASSQIESYLSGDDNNEDKKVQAFSMLKRNLSDIAEIDKNINHLNNTNLNAHDSYLYIQQAYNRIIEYIDRNVFFMNLDPKEFEGNLERIRNDYKHAYACIKRYLSGRDRSEANQLQAVQKLEMCLGEVKQIEKHLDMFLLNRLSNNITKTHNNIFEYIEKYGYSDNKGHQDLIENSEDINRKYEQAKSTIKESFVENSRDRKKKCEAFSVLEELEKELNLFLANEINAKILQICNILNKKEKYIDPGKKEHLDFKERLESIEDQRKDANAKLKPCFSRNSISEEEKYSGFEILEKCLEETRIVENDMIPFLIDPIILKVDQGYSELLRYADRSSLLTEQELEQLDQTIVDIKEYFSVSDENTEDTYALLRDIFDNINKLERKISLLLQLQVLYNNYVKVANKVEFCLNNTLQEHFEVKNAREMLGLDSTKNKFQKIKKVLMDNTIPPHREYIREISLDECHKNIETLVKQAYQLLGINIKLSSLNSK